MSTLTGHFRMEMQDRSAADRLAHNQQAGGSTPSPASILPDSDVEKARRHLREVLAQSQKKLRSLMARRFPNRGWEPARKAAR